MIIHLSIRGVALALLLASTGAEAGSTRVDQVGEHIGLHVRQCGSDHHLHVVQVGSNMQATVTHCSEDHDTLVVQDSFGPPRIR